MEIRTTIFVRLVIWLVAITMPVQSLPAESCGCAGCDIDRNAKPEKRYACPASPRQEAAGCCCSRQKATSEATCCSQTQQASAPHCGCEENCRCRQSEPSQPSTPISPESRSVQVAQLGCPANAGVLFQAPQSVPGTLTASPTDIASTALDRCAALCRFTL